MKAQSTTEEGRELTGAGPTLEQIPLRSALRANAVFSGASGLAIAVASAILPELLGAGSVAFYLVIGLFLMAFSLRLILLARKEHIPRNEGLGVVLGDIAWVVGSIVVIALGILTTVGAILVGVTAVAVGGFAVWQAMTLPPE